MSFKKQSVVVVATGTFSHNVGAGPVNEVQFLNVLPKLVTLGVELNSVLGIAVKFVHPLKVLGKVVAFIL